MAVVRKQIDSKVEIAAIAERTVIKYPNGEPARLPFMLREIRRHEGADAMLDVLAADGCRQAINAVEHDRRKQAHWMDEAPEVETPEPVPFDKAAARLRERSPEMLRQIDADRTAGVLEMMCNVGGARMKLGDMTLENLKSAKAFSRSTARTHNTYDKLYSWVEARIKGGQIVRKQIKGLAAKELQNFWEGISRDA